ncbi:hypothetical protein LJC15_03935 [Desulfovibrio sp. OttesenSCG-928-G11]|nr:hypothetical protein [Desulfovibrio sp. OttesenSCG-928-G11]
MPWRLCRFSALPLLQVLISNSSQANAPLTLDNSGGFNNPKDGQYKDWLKYHSRSIMDWYGLIVAVETLRCKGIAQILQKLIIIPQLIGYNHEFVFPKRDVLLHSISSLMLFPNEKDQQNFSCYLALCYQHLLHELVQERQPTDKIFPAFLDVLASLLDGQPLSNPFSSRQAEAFKHYTAALHEARFSQDGKGSLQERFIRGFFAGIMLNLALTEKISLTKAAKRLEDSWPELKREEPDLHGMAPDVTPTNLLQNVWPVFKDVAHLWAALQDFSHTLPSLKDVFHPFDLRDLVEKSSIIVKDPDTQKMVRVPLTIWPSQGGGWYAFLYKANHILDVGLGKDGSKPLLSEANCWRFVLSDPKSS